MKHCTDWEDEGYSEWAEQERLIREDLKEMRKRIAENHRKVEQEENHERISIAGPAEPGKD